MPFCSVIWPLSPARNARVPAGLKDLCPANAVGLPNKEPGGLIRPQCANNLWWTLPPMDELAMKALAEATKEFHGDTHRIYLTGLSMGGYGAWHLAQKYHGTFAALVVICGGIRPPAAAQKAYPDHVKFTPPDSPKSYTAAADRVGKIPVWIFHGTNDDIVPVTESQRT